MGFTADTYFITPQGSRQLRDLKPGDWVLGAKDFFQIKAIKSLGIQPIFRIRLSDKSFIDCTGDQEWAVISHSHYVFKKQKKGEKGYREKFTDWQAKYRKTVTLKRRLKEKDGRPANMMKPMGEIEFVSNKHIIHPYVMGVFLSTGVVWQRGRQVQLNDQNREKFRSLLPPDTSIKYIPDSYNMFSFLDKTKKSLVGNQFFEETKRLKLIYDKESRIIPDEYLFDSVENRIELLKGFFSTRGFYGRNKINVSSPSLQMMKDIKFLVYSLGGKARIYKYKKELRWHVIECKIPNEERFTCSLKKEIKIPKRKYCQVAFRITDIEYLREDQAYDISVEGGFLMMDNFLALAKTARAR